MLKSIVKAALNITGLTSAGYAAGGGRGIPIGAMFVAAWLSTATALANGPESRAVPAQTPESQSLRLRFYDGLLSLHASHRPYAEVLGAIQKETGIRFHYTIPVSGAVTLSFNDLPVQEVLKRLLGREAQLMFRFPEGPGAAARAGVPEEVWTLGKVSGPIAEAGGPADKSAPRSAKAALPGLNRRRRPLPRMSRRRGPTRQPASSRTSNRSSNPLSPRTRCGVWRPSRPSPGAARRTKGRRCGAECGAHGRA
jgi:hypothetical protein